MDRTIWVFFLSLFLVVYTANSESYEVKLSLIKFFEQLSNSNGPIDPSWGWNMTSDPCTDGWKGVDCHNNLKTVKRIILEGLNLTGTLDSASLCTVPTLSYLSIINNSISGVISEDIKNCHEMTHLLISGNRFSGNLPESLPRLVNLKKVNISHNSFSGHLPNFSGVSGLVTFLAQNNQLSGEIPTFNFANLKDFNVSFNNFSGRIPDVGGHFHADSFEGNPELCGEPLAKACPPSTKGSKGFNYKLLMYFGYIILGLLVVFLIALRLIKISTKKEKDEVVKKGVSVDNNQIKPASTSTEYKTGTSKSEYSISAESGIMSSSLVVLTSPVTKELKFDDLLKAPAELLGRGKCGSVYKVVFENGVTLAVKRMKDWAISDEEFKEKMQKIDQVKHPNVLPVVAFYCSKQEKLVVYEYQQNGSLFKFLHGTQNSQKIDWGTRLNVASCIAEGLVFMHNELREEGIAHGNLKSSNILLNKNMVPCISEYGLMVVDNKDQSLGLGNGYKVMDNSRAEAYSTFKADIYGFGVILLELLTGKLVKNNGVDLTRWVHSVVREEWTVEVFDRALISEGASEERMVNLLQIALKCINPSPEARPSINQVTVMINTIKEEEERSFTFDEP